MTAQYKVIKSIKGFICLFIYVYVCVYVYVKSAKSKGSICFRYGWIQGFKLYDQDCVFHLFNSVLGLALSVGQPLVSSRLTVYQLSCMRGKNLFFDNSSKILKLQ